MGFLSRTPRGRVATAAGYQHLGEKAPIQVISLFDTPAQDA
jgi:Holliday junction DNA helicase RuvB